MRSKASLQQYEGSSDYNINNYGVYTHQNQETEADICEVFNLTKIEENGSKRQHSRGSAQNRYNK